MAKTILLETKMGDGYKVVTYRTDGNKELLKADHKRNVANYRPPLHPPRSLADRLKKN